MYKEMILRDPFQKNFARALSAVIKCISLVSIASRLNVTRIAVNIIGIAIMPTTL